MIVQIDSTPIPREDWFHTPIGKTPQTRNVHVVPGINQRVIIRDVAMPGGVILQGFLEADAADIDLARQGLHDLIDIYTGYKSDGSLHTLDLDTKTYTDVYLHEFRTQGGVIPVAVASGVRLKMRCFFHWMLTHN